LAEKRGAREEALILEEEMHRFFHEGRGLELDGLGQKRVR
jgi:hypothetical protein